MSAAPPKYIAIVTDCITGEQSRKYIATQDEMNDYGLTLVSKLAVTHFIIALETGVIVWSNTGDSFNKRLHAAEILKRLESAKPMTSKA